MNSSIVCLQDGAQFEFTVVESAGKTYLEGWQIGALYSRRVPFDPAKDDREACERKLIERTLYPKYNVVVYGQTRLDEIKDA